MVDNAITTSVTIVQARELTERFRTAAQSLADAVAELRELVPTIYTSGAWRVLGYDTWAAYCQAEVGARLVRIGKTDRQELVQLLAEEGMSGRAIAAALGVDEGTVRGDRRALGSAEFSAPEEQPESRFQQVRDSVVEGLRRGNFDVHDTELIDEITADIYDHRVVHEAARDVLRFGRKVPPPQAEWKPLPPPSSRRGVREQRNRLAEWELNVMREAGRFLNWCEDAGIEMNDETRQVRFPERLRYPLDDEHPSLPDDFTAEDAHQAALGAFYLWWLTLDELRTMAEGGWSQ
jgi:transposase